MIETERLRHRPLANGDAGFLFELMTDPDWLRFIGDRGIASAEDAGEYLRRSYLPMYDRPGMGLMAVEVRETGEPAGICGVLRRDGLDAPDLGFAFLPRFRGRGFAHEAASASLHHAHTALGLTRVAAIVHPANTASLRLLERLGFRWERAHRTEGGTLSLLVWEAPPSPATPTDSRQGRAAGASSRGAAIVARGWPQ